MQPSVSPSVQPSEQPSQLPSLTPSEMPSLNPSEIPSEDPSVEPSAAPSVSPSVMPSTAPTQQPSAVPSVAPSTIPSDVPTVFPSRSPSIAPTARPSPVPGTPTIAPTKAEVYAFAAGQTLIGIDASTFTSDPNNELSFKVSVAAFMPPLTSDNIDITNVTDNASRRLALRSRGLTSSSISIGYIVSFNIFSTGFTDVTTAFSSFTSSLNDSLSDGSFNAYMQDYSSEVGATALTTVESAPTVSFTEPVVVVTDDDTPVADDGESHPKSTHVALIVGIVVGLGGGLLVICLIAYYILFYEKSTSTRYLTNSEVAGAGAESSNQTQHIRITANELDEIGNGQHNNDFRYRNPGIKLPSSEVEQYRHDETRI